MPLHPKRHRSSASLLTSLLTSVVVSVICPGGLAQAATPIVDGTHSNFRKDAEAIGAVMARSVDAWAAGDLDAFMQSYEDGPSTLFVGEQGVVRGRMQSRSATQPNSAAVVLVAWEP